MSLNRLISYTHLKRAYTKSPLWLKSLYACIPFSLRAGNFFRNTCRVIQETEHLDESQLHAMQEQGLRDLIRHACANVPYYRHTFKQCGLLPTDIRTLQDLAKIPLLSKEAIRVRTVDLCARDGVGEPCYWDNTGGSTGMPLRFLKPNSMYQIESAYMLAQWARIGYTPRERKITLRGHIIAKGNSPSRWRYNPIYNELILSSFHLDVETIARFLTEIRRFRPTFIHGYPSAITLLLHTMAAQGMCFPVQIKGVLCGSEPLYDYQRAFISRTLGCRVFSWYGQSECVVLAGECEHSPSYHVFPMYGVVELVDDDGHVIEQPGIEGEIVGTSLNNRAMPFVRYRTGDRGVYDDFGRCTCGREYRRLKRVTGRTQDYIYTCSGRAVPVTALVFAQHFRAFANILGLQLVQEAPGNLILRIVQGQGYSNSDEQEMKRKIECSVDQELRVTFAYVEELAVTNAGKSPFLIQNVEARDGGLSSHASFD